MPDDFDADLERYLHARLKSKSRVQDFFRELWSKPQPLEKKENEAPTELKELAKISLGVIRQLSDEELKLFKQSPEFEKIKEILKKHELIR